MNNERKMFINSCCNIYLHIVINIKDHKKKLFRMENRKSLEYIYASIILVYASWNKGRLALWRKNEMVNFNFVKDFKRIVYKSE